MIEKAFLQQKRVKQIPTHTFETEMQSLNLKSQIVESV